jgi:16S rRNA (guanine966-N2)-methyltransferase
MRVIGGKLRGRKLASPPDERIRPTSDRARESLFNILAHADLTPDGTSPLAGAVVLDACCGTGAMGIEALSRGAARAAFLDSDPAALDLVRASLKALGITGAILRVDVRHPGRATDAATLVFLDPPYGEGIAAPALTALAAHGWIAPGALVVVETGPRDDFAPPAGFSALDNRKYGKARFALLRYTGQVPSA